MIFRYIENLFPRFLKVPGSGKVEAAKYLTDS